MKKFNAEWRKYVIILFIIFIIGLFGFLVPYGNSKWNFIFENMMWLPFELVLTVIAINKILELIEDERNYEKFAYIAGEKNKYLIEAIKRHIVHIAIDCQVHDENRNEIELYNKILMNPTKYFNDKLFASSRKYLTTNSSGQIQKENYNYNGILYVHCNELDQRLVKYIEEFNFYFDDKLFKQINDFKTLNYGFGTLNSAIGLSFEKNIVAPESYNYLQKEALNYIIEAEEIINLLEKY